MRGNPRKLWNKKKKISALRSRPCDKFNDGYF